MSDVVATRSLLPIAAVALAAAGLAWAAFNAASAPAAPAVALRDDAKARSAAPAPISAATQSPAASGVSSPERSALASTLALLRASRNPADHFKAYQVAQRCLVARRVANELAQPNQHPDLANAAQARQAAQTELSAACTGLQDGDFADTWRDLKIAVDAGVAGAHQAWAEANPGGTPVLRAHLESAAERGDLSALRELSQLDETSNPQQALAYWMAMTRLMPKKGARPSKTTTDRGAILRASLSPEQQDQAAAWADNWLAGHHGGN